MSQINLRELYEKLSRGQITEASLSRIFHHVDVGEGFALLSAGRSENSSAENSKNHGLLRQDIRSGGFGYIQTVGHWTETLDDGTKEPVEEMSIFVPKMPPEEALKLGEKYGQEAVIYGDETGIYYLWVGGEKEKIGDRMSVKVVNDAYSKLKGKPFTFEGIRYVPSGYIDYLGWSLKLRKIVEASE